jgi:hypothetical protein
VTNPIESMSSPVFEETQGFRQTWLIGLLVFLLAMCLVFVISSSYVQLYQGKPFGNKPMGDTGLIILNIFLFVVGFLLPVLVLRLKLITRLERDALYLKFGILANKTYPLDDIVSCEAITYRPIIDFGGWGIRYSLALKQWAYNVSGNRGVRIEFSNGKKIVIGSQKPDEFANALSGLKSG